MSLMLIARLVLAAVFGVAGVAKLVDRRGTRAAVLAFGAPMRIAGALAIALPLAELATMSLLLPAETAIYGAAAAVALLAVFSAALAWNLARGRAPDCHCFGQLHSAPASWKTLVRNGALLVIAALVLADSLVNKPESAVAWVGGLSRAELLALVALVTITGALAVGIAALVTLTRSYGHVLVRLDRIEVALAEAGVARGEDYELPQIGLAPGTRVPFFATRSIDGSEFSQSTLAAADIPTLLLFTSPQCGPCTSLLPTVAEWQRDHADTFSLVVASAGTPDEARAEAEGHGLERVIADPDNRLSELFQANGTPSAVVVAPGGTIGSWVAAGAEWIEQLAAELSEGEAGLGLPAGADAPAIELPSLDGEQVSLESLRGRDALLLFWNPDCGYCRQMRDDLLEWERSANGVTPQLVIVSSGDEESTRAEGFRSLVLLDEAFAAGTAFSANGTPMAVLLDSNGRIGSPVVAGAEAVLALADGH